MTTRTYTNRRYLDALEKKVLVFDGAMGTSLQTQNLTAEHFGGEKYNGCNDFLVISFPEAVEKVHRSFMEVGVDVLETDTFRSNRLTLGEYGLGERTLEINIAAASLARRTEPLPMLLEHAPRLLAGCWTDVREDGRGLWLRGEICDDLPGAACARRALARGVDGLSIGFVPLAAHRSAGVRVLTEIELLEVSIVAHPMQRFARLSARFGSRQSAIANRGPAAADYRLPTAA